MATKKEEVGSMYDMDSVPETTNNAPARIETPGILHNLSISFEMVDGDYKDEAAKAAAPDGKWHGFSVTVKDEAGLELSEVYFMPPQKEEDVKYLQKDFKLVDGKTIEAGEANAKRSLQILNNEFMAYLIDIGEALGYTNGDVREKLRKHAKGFLELGKGFIETFKVAETTRVSAKVLYNNNKTKETSFLKIHGSYPVYYPYGNDLFDIYEKNRPTLLKLTNWEANNGMIKKYTNDTNAPKDGAVTSGESWKPADIANDVDPF